MPPKASDPPSRANGSTAGKGRTKSRQQMPRPPKGQLFGPESMRLKAGGPALNAAGVPRIPPPAPPLESDDWPEDVEELTQGYKASPGLSEPLRVQLCSAIDEADPLSPASTRGNVCFRWISANSSHPAAGQYGLFAARDLPPRTPLALYLGTIHTNEESDPNSEYDLGFTGPNGESLGIDATKGGSIARFANDYRGVATRPNAEFKEVTLRLATTASATVAASKADDQGSDEEDEADLSQALDKLDVSADKPSTTSATVKPRNMSGMAIFSASKPIRRGEEVVLTYGAGFWAARREATAGKKYKR